MAITGPELKLAADQSLNRHTSAASDTTGGGRGPVLLVLNWTSVVSERHLACDEIFGNPLVQYLVHESVMLA